MISTLLGLIFMLVVLGVLYWAFLRIMALIPLGEPFATLVNIVVVVLGVIICLYVVQELLAAGGVKVPWPRLS